MVGEGLRRYTSVIVAGKPMTSRAPRENRVAAERMHRLLPVSLDPDPTIDRYKEGVDRTLLRENLKLTPSERVAKMISAYGFAEAVRRSRPVSGGR